MRGSILPVTIPPPGTPPGKPSPSGPGVGNFLKRSCPRVGGGANRNNYSCKDLWGDTMAATGTTRKRQRFSFFTCRKFAVRELT